MLSGLGRYVPGQRSVEAEAADQCRAAGRVLRLHGARPGSPDYGKQALTVAQKLGSAGDQDGALKFLTLAQTAADKAQAPLATIAISAFDQTEAQRAQSNADRAFNKDKYAIKEQTNPDTGETTFVRINTEGPEGAINTGLPVLQLASRTESLCTCR
jgi:hypothetical protein